MSNISIEQIKSKYEGKLINIDGAFGSQCVDLSLVIARDISGIKDLSVYCDETGGAVDFALSQNCQNKWAEYGFKWVENDPNNPDQVPNCPAIFVESPFYSIYGHTGAILESFAGQDRLITIEQNTGSGDGYGQDDVTTVKDRNYNRIIGWYEYPSQESQPVQEQEINYDGLDKAEADAIKVHDKIALRDYFNDRHTEIRDLNKKISQYDDQFEEDITKIKDLEFKLNKVTIPPFVIPIEQYVKSIENTPVTPVSKPQKFSFDKFLVGMSKDATLTGTILTMLTYLQSILINDPKMTFLCGFLTITITALKAVANANSKMK